MHNTLVCLISSLALLNPTAFCRKVLLRDTNAKGKQSKIEPTEKGLKIVTTAQASVLADDADLLIWL
ncbi:MAG: hypothetical protein CM15mP129_08740 [Chloroflexota bacterium]|nr:MAG: hypothetical protein CM15mP129_08740 [Chloroflexota bacterium]